jgi:Uma2 family endonuclease
MSEMEATATAPEADSGTTPNRIRPITVAEFHRMLKLGILSERERVELLDGQLIAMPPEGPVHADVVAMLNAELVQRFAGRALVRPGNPIQLNPTSEPHPDITLVRRRDARYLEAHPRPEDVLLVIEVSSTSLAYDRHDKLRMYARAGITEVWIVDLVHRRVETYAEPHPLGYAATRVVKRNQSVAPRAFPEDAVPAASFLP